MTIFKTDKKMKVMGVDPSTHVGVVILDFCSSEKCGYKIELLTEIVASGCTGIDRAGKLADQVLQLINEHEVSFVIVEGYSFASAYVNIGIIEIGAVLRYQLQCAGKVYVEVPPTSLKKFVTGKGNCKKNLILLKVFSKWGVELSSDNVADAFGLAMMAGAAWGIVDMPKVNMGAVEGLSEYRILKNASPRTTLK